MTRNAQSRFTLEMYVAALIPEHWNAVLHRIAVETDASKASQTYQYNDSRGGCYSETLTAANNVLTNVKKDCKHE